VTRAVEPVGQRESEAAARVGNFRAKFFQDFEVRVEFATRPASLAMVVRRTAANGLGLERRDETQNVVLASVGLR
jgi:hypothetical protein